MAFATINIHRYAKEIEQSRQNNVVFLSLMTNWYQLLTVVELPCFSRRCHHSQQEETLAASEPCLLIFTLYIQI